MTFKNLNTKPYFDDFDPYKQSYKILFRPKYPVQARELTQLQTILQNQIDSLGKHVFQNKSMVIPGEIKYDNKYNWIKIPKTSSANNVTELETFWLNQTITGGNGLQALVVGYILPNAQNETVLYLKYTKSSSSGTVGVFAAGDTITNGAISTAVPASSVNPEGVVGVGSVAHITEGIYFVSPYFLLVKSQSVLLEPFSSTPSYRVGLDIVDTFVTPEADESLLSNATGIENSKAPGAHRYKIDLELSKRTLDLNSPVTSDDSNFIELMRVDAGEIVSRVSRSDYAILEKTLAERTSDESGDYTVDDFDLEVREFYRENNNNGIYEDSAFFYGTSAEADAVARSRFGLTGSAGTLWHLDPNGSGKAMPGATHQAFQDAARSMLVLCLDKGKAYVKGYQIETISRKLIDYNKSRTSDTLKNSTIETQIGNYVLVENVNNLPDITTYPTVDLYDTRIASDGVSSGTKIGTARVRGIEYDSGTIAVDMDAAIFKLFLFDIKTINGAKFEQVKSIYMDRGATLLDDFTCNIALEEFPLSGSVSITTGGVVTGVGTYFQSLQSDALIPNVDWIKVYDGTTLVGYHKVTAVTTDTAATVSPNPGVAITSKNFSYVYASLKGTTQEQAIFRLPYSPIKTIRDESNAVKTIITCQREFTVTAVSDVITLNLADVYEDFAEFNNVNYVFTKQSGGGAAPIGRIFNYNGITKTGQTVANPSGPTTAQIVFSHADFNNDVIRVIATITKKGSTASQEKSKTLQVSSVVSSASGVTNLTELSLGKADIYKIRKITMAADFTTAPLAGDPDITSRYNLDNGQRDSFYDLGRVLLKPGQPAPTGRIRVEFDYFSHSNANKNYFSVNSYAIPYGDIPTYISAESGLVYDLRNCLDFRPRINDAGTAYDNTTGALVEFPTNNTTADYQYYLNRSDKLSLDTAGNFLLKYGTPAVYPKEPESPENSMLLYNLDAQAYTFTPKSLIARKVDNRRYTMRDIGRIEKRVENLEYYTALSLLEKETKDFEVKDADGLDRFKNGFIVDSFEGHGIGDVLNPDYRCSIDMQQKEMRPPFNQDNIKLYPTGSISNVTSYGELMMITRTDDVVMASQPLASNFMNINPYAVFTFIGSIKLVPDNDEWKETEVLPDLVIQQEGNYAQIAAQAEAMGTVWGEWQTNWTGQSVDRNVTRTRDYSNSPNRPNAQHDRPWPFKQTTVVRTTTTKTGIESRSGIRQTVIPDIQTLRLGQRVVDVSYIPYMRMRDVQIQAKGLKPNTRLYAFFDGIPVSKYVSSGVSYNPSNNILTGATPLITDATGSCTATFRIPGKIKAGFEGSPDEGIFFRTGQKQFKLIDNVDNSPNFFTMGVGQYSAQGLLEIKQDTVVSIRNAILVPEAVSEDRAVSSSSTSAETSTKWVDPLAQSFLVTEPNGVFLSRIAIYFQSKDTNIPVTLQIREMVNGYPGQKILPFGQVVLPAASVTTSADASVETNFVFDSPVYCQPNTEYCFVLMANSVNYNVWIGRLGQNVLNTQIPIQEQPYAGVLFKSQNASTWTADQEADMKFNIFKAQWIPNSAGSVTFSNDTTDLSFKRLLGSSPLQTISGSNKIRVYHPNHGMPSTVSVQSRVILTNVTPTSGAVLNGIPLAEFQGISMPITDVDMDSYTITATTNANASGFAGGSLVNATQNRQMDAMQSIIGQFVLPQTSINYGIKTTSSRSPWGTETPYVVDSTYMDHIPNETIEFSTPRMICSAQNETNATIPGGSKTFFMLASMVTTDPNISPAIDLKRTSVVAIGNRLDNSDITNSNFLPFDEISIVAANANIKFTVTSNFISVNTDATTIDALRKITIGKYITVSGAVNGANNGQMLVTDVQYDSTLGSDRLKLFVNKALVTETGGTITIKLHNRFTSDIAPLGSSSLSQYMTRRVTFAQPANGLLVRMSAYRPSSGDIKVYYKISQVDKQGRFDDFAYVQATLDTSVPASVNRDDLREYVFTVNNLPDYTIVSVKVVLDGTNTADVPRVKDLQVIGLGT